MGSDVDSAVAAVWRRESARLIAALLRITQDVQLAEDLAQDALVAALEQWPSEGIPTNPGAWLMAVAKRRAVDHFRRAGAERDPRMAEAVEVVRSKRGPDGRWLLEHVHPGRVHLDLEGPVGTPSRWNTLRALRVLAWWDRTS